MHVCKDCNEVLIPYLMVTNKKRKEKKDNTNKHRKKYLYLIKEKNNPQRRAQKCKTSVNRSCHIGHIFKYIQIVKIIVFVFLARWSTSDCYWIINEFISWWHPFLASGSSYLYWLNMYHLFYLENPVIFPFLFAHTSLWHRRRFDPINFFCMTRFWWLPALKSKF